MPELQPGQPEIPLHREQVREPLCAITDRLFTDKASELKARAEDYKEHHAVVVLMASGIDPLVLEKWKNAGKAWWDLLKACLGAIRTEAEALLAQ